MQLKRQKAREKLISTRNPLKTLHIYLECSLENYVSASSLATKNRTKFNKSIKLYF